MRSGSGSKEMEVYFSADLVIFLAILVSLMPQARAGCEIIIQRTFSARPQHHQTQKITQLTLPETPPRRREDVLGGRLAQAIFQVQQYC